MKFVLQHRKGGYLQLTREGRAGQWCYTDEIDNATVFQAALSRETGQLAVTPPLPFDLNLTEDSEQISHYRPVAVKTEGL